MAVMGSKRIKGNHINNCYKIFKDIYFPAAICGVSSGENMQELNSCEVGEVSGGVIFLVPLTPAIATGIAVGATALGATAVATFVGLRAFFNEM